jgi:DNA-binding NarL/FixJ family response regulator
MKPKTTILLVEDEALIREGVRSLLEKEPFGPRILEASSKKEVLCLPLNEVDVILLDFRLRDCNALDLIPRIKEQSRAKIVVVTGLEGSELMANLIYAGVHSVVHKLDGYIEIKTAIERVLKNDVYFPSDVVKVIHRHADGWPKIPPVALSFAEKELIIAISTGLTTKQIAVQLKMTEATTETYRLRLIKKLGVPNTAAMMAYAFRNGIL